MVWVAYHIDIPKRPEEKAYKILNQSRFFYIHYWNVYWAVRGTLAVNQVFHNRPVNGDIFSW